VQVSPVDIQAWASDTGSEYPATPAEKAAVLPAVAAWKAEQLADAKASRGENAISPLAVGAGAAGLGLAGLLAFNHFRKQGLSEPAAAQLAKNAENQAAATATAVQTPPTAPPPTQTTGWKPWQTPDHRLVDTNTQNVRPASPGGPALRADYEAGPIAATQEIRGGRSLGGSLAREQGQYKARTDQGFHNPALQGLDTPKERIIYLAGIADAHGTDSAEFQQAQQLIASLETTTAPGIAPTAFTAGLTPEQRYGSTTAEEEAASGKHLGQSRTKSNASAQAGYQSRDTAVQAQAKVFSPQARANQQADALADALSQPGPGDMGATDANNSAIDPEVIRQLEALNTGKGNINAPKASKARRPIGIDPSKASVFFLDVDGTYKPYLGSRPVLGPENVVLSTGRRADGSPIAESDLAFFPTDDPEFYRRSSSAIAHPFLSDIDIAENRGSQPDLRYATDEDQAIKGLLESLPVSDPRFSTGIRKDGVSDNWTVGANGANERVPLDVSGFQSEASNPTRLAATRLKIAVDDHLKTTGQLPPPAVQQVWATALAREHAVDPISVLRAAKGVTAPTPTRTSRSSAPALAAGSGDALDRVYNSLGMHAGANAWELEGMVRSGDIKTAAAALASQLPALTSVNAGGLRGASQDEKLNIVAEGVSAGLKDLAVTLEKYPQAAEKFGIGKGAGGFGIDAYLKSYVRDWVTVRGLQLDPTGQPTYQVPNDAFEILAHQAHNAGRSTLAELEDHIRGAANGLEGALKIDRLVSAAQSTKQSDPNTNATNFAQTVFDLRDPDLISTRLTQEAAGDVKLSFGTRRNYDATAGFYDRNPNEAQLAEAIENYNTLSDGADAGYGLNSVLSARNSGADYKTPEGRAQQQAAKDAQAWITANATRLEQERADLNRGILRTDDTPKSFGRGFVIASDHRGAYLAGDTQGLNTSIRDEQFNDLDATPVDRAQDNQREALLNNQVPEPEGVDAADDRLLAPLTEAEATARQYGATKLHFKNLGPNSRGAMPAGEAFYPRQHLRRYLQEQGQDEAVGRILDSYIGSTWQPEAGVGFEVGASEPVRGLGPRPAPPAAPITLQVPPEHEPTLLSRPEGIPDGAVDSYQSWYRPAAVRVGTVYGERPITLQNGEVVSIPTIALHGTWKHRATHPRQPLSAEQVFSLVDQQPRAVVAPEINTETAARHRAALEARGVGSGESFRDDQNFRDAIAAEAADVLQLDRGEVSGLGRRGSTFPQAPIAAAPVSLVPAAAIDQLNTLRSSLERPVTAAYSAQELHDARARHIGDYISSAATPAFDKAGRQTRGWTGGDSWHGGARLAGRADRNVGAYNAPSDAMLSALALAARRRAGVN
jgi:hypothetical protein